MATAKETTKPLQGYRIALLRDPYAYSDSTYRDAGASLLHVLLEASAENEEAFQQWWQRENEIASQAGLTMVVMKPVTYQAESYRLRKWLDTIEEDEWYADEGGQGRVRYVTSTMVTKTIATGELLRDEWEEDIERGVAAFLGLDGSSGEE